MNNENTENALKITQYIKNHPNCTVPKQITIMLQGKKIDLETFRLPIELTFYNIKNGRFAAEYVDKVKEVGHELNPTDPRDSQKIQKLLIEIDPKQSTILQQDIQISGQRDPGIITYDGYVINGNRRRAALEELIAAGHSEFKFIEVARLPQNVSPPDLWKLEAGIQLSKNIQLDYGPINELLKFQEGIDAGLTAIEIAKSLYGGFKEKDILEKLEQLKLIAEYLQFIGQPGVFNRAKGVHEHFIDARNVINAFRKQGASPDEIVAAKRILFQLIFDDVPQRDLRKVKDILANEKVKKDFWKAIEYSKPGEYAKKVAQKLEADKEEAFTPARAIFINCLESERAIKDSGEPEKLLRRALTNLENVELDSTTLKNPEIKSLISQIEVIIKKLQ